MILRRWTHEISLDLLKRNPYVNASAENGYITITGRQQAVLEADSDFTKMIETTFMSAHMRLLHTDLSEHDPKMKELIQSINRTYNVWMEIIEDRGRTIHLDGRSEDVERAKTYVFENFKTWRGQQNRNLESPKQYGRKPQTEK